MRVAIGVDVAARRGCDVVVLGDDLVARPVGRVHTIGDLRALLATIRPAVVAIDAPPCWGRPGAARACERALTARGISIFRTPDAARGEANRFYDWMRTGFAMFAGAAPYPALETFPHATAVAVMGTRPERGLLRDPAAKRAWRRRALETAMVDHSELRTIDEIDAALCALTGRAYLVGTAVELGDREEGVIVVPAGLPEPRAATTRTP
jgi:predicted nuclease with RNAse H fold